MPYKDKEKKRARAKAYAKAHRAQFNARSRIYNKAFRKSASLGLATNSDTGQASEYLVASDFLARGLRTTKPLNVNGDHDLHVHCGGRWVNVQVKTADINIKTGRILTVRTKVYGRPMTSDILALVDLKNRRIEYRPAKTEVPYELTDAYIALNPEDANA